MECKHRGSKVLILNVSVDNSVQTLQHHIFINKFIIVFHCEFLCLNQIVARIIENVFNYNCNKNIYALNRQDKMPSDPANNTNTLSVIYASNVETKDNLCGFEHAYFSFVRSNHKLKKAEEKLKL